jgi:hypothetical protein
VNCQSFILSRILVCVAVAALAGSPANAYEITWTGNDGNDWFYLGNWSGFEFGVVPTTNDTAIINNGDSVFVTRNFAASDQINGLTLSGGSKLLNVPTANVLEPSGYELIVDNNGSALTQLSGAGTELIIYENASGESQDGFDTDLMAVNSGATVSIGNGRLEVDSFLAGANSSVSLDINSGATLRGYGWVDLQASSPSTFNALQNDGLIHVYGYGLAGTYQVALAINVTNGNGRIDLDGSSGTGTVQIDDFGQLEINAPLADDFDGLITMGRSTVLRMDSDWTNNRSSSSLMGDIVVNAGSGTARIRGGTTPNTFTNKGNITVNSGTLHLDSITNLSGGAIQVSGGVSQNADAAVNAPTIISGAGFWDLDGTSGTSHWEVNDALTLNVARIESGSGSQVFDGRIDLNGAGTTMTVNTAGPWTMNGTLNLNSGTLAGIAQMAVTGSISATNGKITSPTLWQSGASVSLGRGSEGFQLELDGPTTYQGGTYRGGTIRQDGEANVTSSTTLGTNTYTAVIPNGVPPYQRNWLQTFDLDGTVESSAVTNISPGATFTINAVEIDIGADGYDGTLNINGGNLIVNTATRIETPLPPNAPIGATYPPIIYPLPWRLDGTANLSEVGGNPAVISSQYGSPLIISGRVNALSGNASFTSLGITLATGSQIQVRDGATLNMNASGAGSIAVNSGGLLRLNATSTLNTTQLNIDGTAEFAANVTVQGGAFTGAGVLRMLGNTHITHSTPLEVDTEFAPGSITTIDSGRELQLGRTGRVQSGAIFQGAGILHNLQDATLHLLHGADVEVQISNAGKLTLGSSPGTATVDEFTQSSTGVLEIEVAGYTAGTQYDQLIVTGAATLDGRLEVPILQSFAVVPTQRINFLTAASTTGEFRTVVAPDLRQRLPGKAFNLVYETGGAHLVFDNIQDNIVLDDPSTMVPWNSPAAWRDVDNIVSPAIPTLLHHVTLQNIVPPQAPAAQMVLVEDTRAFMAQLTVGGGGLEDLILKVGNVSGAGPPGILSATVDVSIQDLGAIDLYDGTVVTSQLTIEGGELLGQGTIDLSGASTSGPGKVSITSGRVSPGNSAGDLGVVEIRGDLLLTGDGEIRFEVGSVTDRDVIQVTGDLDLESRIVLDSSPGGLMPGEETTLMTASSIDLLPGFDVLTSERLFVRKVTAAGSVAAARSAGKSLASSVAGGEELVADLKVPGDLDGDGYINADDIRWFALALKKVDLYQLRLFEERNVFASQSKPDYDGNTIVDFDDIDDFAAAVGMSPSRVTQLIAMSLQVPEPSATWKLLGAGLILVLQHGSWGRSWGKTCGSCRAQDGGRVLR